MCSQRGAPRPITGASPLGCQECQEGHFTLLPFNDPAVCGPLFVDQPRTETGNLKLRVENRCSNGVKGATCPRYEGCPHRDKFR